MDIERAVPQLYTIERDGRNVIDASNRSLMAWKGHYRDRVMKRNAKRCLRPREIIIHGESLHIILTILHILRRFNDPILGFNTCTLLKNYSCLDV